MLNHTTFCQSFSKLLDHYGLSRRDAAEKFNVSLTTIQKLATGGTVPSIDIVYNIIEKYPEVNLRWLFMGEGNMIQDTGDRGRVDKLITDKDSVIQILKDTIDSKDMVISHLKAMSSIQETLRLLSNLSNKKP